MKAADDVIMPRLDPRKVNMPVSSALGIFSEPPRHLFFTGKGGVGKTTLACAVALALADRGRSVLLVSTDPASNLDEMLGTPLANMPRPVSGAPNLSAMNIDPEEAAEAYRQRVLEQMGQQTTEAERATVREQLAGACTTEIAAFDEFVGLLAADSEAFDHVVFDTAPTGHTLRLLSLPKAWTGFLKDKDRGASCLGPHSGLKMQEARFQAALAALGDSARTTIVLVTRPDRGAIREAARTSAELRDLGLRNQRVAINGVFTASDRSDPVARSIENLGQSALAELPEALRSLPQDRVPLRSFDMVGLKALRQVLSGDPAMDKPIHMTALANAPGIPGLGRLVDDLAASGRGLIMVMGKGGVGKTTIAAALAVGLVKRGHSVHLSTTDPAAHVASTLAATMEGLQVDRIDPKAETERYIGKIMSSRSKDLDEAGLALLREDLEVSVHGRGSRVSCFLAHRRGSTKFVRCPRHRADGSHPAANGCDGCLSSRDDQEDSSAGTKPCRDATNATAGPGVFQDYPGRAARDDSGVRSGRTAGGFAPGQNRTLCMGHQPQLAGERNA